MHSNSLCESISLIDAMLSRRYHPAPAHNIISSSIVTLQKTLHVPYSSYLLRPIVQILSNSLALPINLARRQQLIFTSVVTVDFIEVGGAEPSL